MLVERPSNDMDSSWIALSAMFSKTFKSSTRTADDFILSVKGTQEQAASMMDSTRSFFSEKLKLNLSAEKTRVVRLED